MTLPAERYSAVRQLNLLTQIAAGIAATAKPASSAEMM